MTIIHLDTTSKRPEAFNRNSARKSSLFCGRSKWVGCVVCAAVGVLMLLFSEEITSLSSLKKRNQGMYVHNDALDMVLEKGEAEKNLYIVSAEEMKRIRRKKLQNPTTLNISSSIVNCTDLLPPLSWTWRKYSTTESAVRGERILIGMYSDLDENSPSYQMLQKTSTVNKAYAKQHKHDTVTLQGIAYPMVPNDTDCSVLEEYTRRVSFNKIALLELGIQRRWDYDYLLILDPSAMMYNHDFDLTSLVSTTNDDNNYMLTAHKIPSSTDIPPQTWDIHSGILFWNLQHGYTRRVYRAWDRMAHTYLDETPTGGDQSVLHQALQTKEEYIQNINGLSSNEFAYGHGTVARNYFKKDLDTLSQAANEVCQSIYPRCNRVD